MALLARSRRASTSGTNGGLATHDMHVYCDESGGAHDKVFLVAAVRLEPASAERALKSFRKATGWPGEVKGYDLRDRERKLLLDLAFGTPDSGSAVVVVCDTRTPHGRWAAGMCAEAVLRTDMLVEACVAASAGRLGLTYNSVTMDGGRSPRQVLDRERLRLGGAVRAAGLLPENWPRAIAYDQSERVPGLQIADVSPTLCTVASYSPRQRPNSR